MEIRILNNFKKKDLLGEGLFCQVYNLRINNKLYPDYVVKYIKPVLEYQILNTVVNKLSLGRLNDSKKVNYTNLDQSQEGSNN